MTSPKAPPMTDEPEVVKRALHVDNEWADMATSGLQWLRNIRDGISTPEEAIVNMVECLVHCQQVRDEAGLAAAPRAKCRVCNGKGYHAGDPEGAAIEGCSDCLETGFQVNEDEGSKIDLAFVCAGLSAADKRSVVERILALGSRIDQLEAAAPRAGVGWKLVPVEPTEEMLDAGATRPKIGGALPYSIVAAVYRAMLAAAPPAVPDPHAELVAAAYAYRAALEDEFTEKGVIEIERTRTALDEAAERLPDRDEWATEHMTAKEG